MAANVAWKAAKEISGITTPLLNVAAAGEGARCVVPDALHEQPVKPADESIAFGERQAVAIDEPQHVISENVTMTCMSTDSMFLLRTRPP